MEGNAGLMEQQVLTEGIEEGLCPSLAISTKSLQGNGHSLPSIVRMPLEKV
jgi:hypothetical protein